MNSINIPRYCNGNLVYDEIPMNSIITTSTLTSGYSYINSNNNGILVKNNNDISFQTFDGILYYKNNELTSCTLSGNTLLYTNVESTLSQINIGGGVLNTYKFDDNSVETSNADPSFTDKIVLNNCEIVDESNQRINKNYLIYGSSKHGLSPIELDTPSNNYEYYYIVNDLNNNINVSTSSQIYTDLYNTVVNQESIQVPTISAIPICKSNETNQQLDLIIPKMFDNGDYYININSDNTEFSLKNITGSILPSSLYSDDIKDFDYRKYNIYTATSNKNEFTLLKSSSTQFNEPYLSGNGWKDLTTTTFLNSNNLNITESLIYSNPVVIGSDGYMYGVVLPENKKYVLTDNSFEELKITGNGDIQINLINKINLKNIIQLNNDSKLYKLEDRTLSSGILHTTIDGDINISLLTNNDIQDNTITDNKIALNSLNGNKIIDNTITERKIDNNTITGGKIANNTITNNNIKDNTITNGKIAGNTITGGKLFFNDNSQQSWSNIIIDQDNNLYRKYGDFFKNSNYYGVFDYNGNIQSLCANIITEGTMNGDRISEETLQYNRLKISTDPQTSNWSIIAVNSNNNLIKFSNTLSLNNQYGIFDNKGNIVQLTANKISGTIGSNQLGTSSVTTEKIKDNAVTGDKIAQGAVSATQISDNSITSSKLNINSSKPSESWKNLLIDNNNNFVTTNASVKNYGVFKYNGVVTELTTQLLTDIGLNLYIPDGNDNEFNQTFVSADYIFYTSTIQDISVNTNYIKVYNYFNSNKFNNNIIYVNNNIRKFVDIYGNIKNTYTAFSSVNNNYQDYNMKFKTSLYIKNAEINLTNYNDYYRYDNNNNISNISNNFFTSSPILIVGVYTSLCKNNEGTQIIILNNKLYKYTYDSYGSNYCKSTLLGYLPLDVSQLKVGNMNNISINKTFDFECTVFSNNKYLDDFDKISDDLLFFVPMYYINNNNEVEQLNYFNKIITNGNDESKYISDFYTNMFIDNKNILNIIDINLNKKEINSNYFYLNDNDLIIRNYNYIGINNEKGNTNLYLIIDQDNNDNNISNIFMNFDNFNKDDIITIVNDLIIFKYFINEPIEKNIKFNISPITKQSNIIYTRTDPESSSHELNKKIEYKFSLCSITASLTKNTGQYPAIIQ